MPNQADRRHLRVQPASVGPVQLQAMGGRAEPGVGRRDQVVSGRDAEDGRGHRDSEQCQHQELLSPLAPEQPHGPADHRPAGGDATVAGPPTGRPATPRVQRFGLGARSDSGPGGLAVWSTARPSRRNTTRSAQDASCASWVTTTPATPRLQAARQQAHHGLAVDRHFTVHARDGANNPGTSTSMTFTTLPALSDVQPPTVAFVTPAAGAVSGPVTLHASASDDVGVVSVTFNVDGVALGAPDTSAPYTVVWDSTSVADGAHTLTAEARDAVNHVSTATVVVLVQNTPVPSAPHYVGFQDGNDYVRVADAPALSFGNGTTDTPMTIEAWVRPESVSGGHEIVGKAGEYHLTFLYGTLVLQLRDDSSGARTFVAAAANLSSWVGSWHHIAVTYDGRGGATASQGVTIYLDGVAVPVSREDNAAYVAMINRNSPLDIGRDNQHDGVQYTGGLDELRLWNVRRTANEIQLTMGAELSGLEPGLVGYWRFNEGVGAASADDSAESSTRRPRGRHRVADGSIHSRRTRPRLRFPTSSSRT